MATRKRYAIAAALGLSTLFVPFIVGRLAYFFFVWLSQSLGFTPAAIETMRIEALAGGIIGLAALVALIFAALTCIPEFADTNIKPQAAFPPLFPSPPSDGGGAITGAKSIAQGQGHE